MNSFVNSVRNEDNKTVTENGMAAFKSSMNSNVDFFFTAGASRGKDIFRDKFLPALSENRELALRNLLWLRDVRGGAGEREQTRNILCQLEQKDEAAVLEVLPKLAELGRWDDLLIFRSDTFRQASFELIRNALLNGNGLCAKWMPRKGPDAVALREFMELTPKQYRKLLVNLTNVVEQKMCAGQWSEIDFGKLPSVASARYQKAFGRNTPATYSAYKEKLVKGEAKINASAVYPYDITKSLRHGDSAVAEAQWNALPNFLTEGQGIIPMIDVSGSMSSVTVATGVSAMDVAIGLGLYIADKQYGPYHNMFLTFSNHSVLSVLKEHWTLKEKYQFIARSQWDMSTNLESAYNEILRVAIAGNVNPSDMPKYLLIFSDMQFNQATHHGDTAQTMAERKFAAAGYECPKIVYWNLNDRGGNVPVKYDKNGTALVSGFSPALMKSILSAKSFTPEGVMLETLMQDKYDLV